MMGKKTPETWDYYMRYILYYIAIAPYTPSYHIGLLLQRAVMAHLYSGGGLRNAFVVDLRWK